MGRVDEATGEGSVSLKNSFYGVCYACFMTFQTKTDDDNVELYGSWIVSILDLL